MKNDSHCRRWLLPLGMMLTLGACSSSPSVSKRELPEWVNSPGVLFPKERYIASVGTGSTLERAAQNARRSIAEGFRSQVVSQTSSASDSKLAESTDGSASGKSEERFSQQTEIQSHVTLRGAEVRESFVAEDVVYAVVAIDKLTARSGILSELMTKERKVTEALDVAARGKTVRYASVQAAQTQFSQYEVLAGEAVALGVSTGDKARVLSARIESLRAEFIAGLKNLSVNVRQKTGDSSWGSKLSVCLSAHGIPLTDAASENDMSLLVSVSETPLHMAVQGFQKMKVDLLTEWTRAGKKEALISSKTETGRSKEAALEGLQASLIEEHCNKILERL